jgi:hypothetical protein
MIFIRQIDDHFSLRDFQTSINALEGKGLTIKELQHVHAKDHNGSLHLVLIAIFNPISPGDPAGSAKIVADIEEHTARMAAALNPNPNPNPQPPPSAPPAT